MTQEDKQAVPADAPTPEKVEAQPKPRKEKPKAPAAAAASGADAAVPSRRGSGVAVALGLLALLIGLGAVAAAWYAWDQTRQLRVSMAELQQAGQQREEDLNADLNQGLNRLGQELQQNLETVQARQQELTEGLARVRSQAGREQHDWVMAEAEHLLLIANQRLQLQRDIGTAVAALQLADQRLRDLADPALLPVREAIADELAALRAVPQPDISGLAVRLGSLTEQVAALRLPTARPVIGGDEPATAAGSDSGDGAWREDWRRAVDGLWSELKTLVVIRHHDQPIAPMLSAEQEFLVRETLRLRLEAARSALLQSDPALYRSSLGLAQDWLSNRFAPQDSGVEAMAAQLQELAAVPLKPELPDISDSLRLLRAQMERRADRTESSAATSPTAAPEAAERQP